LNANSSTPLPNPPPQGGREHAEFAALLTRKDVLAGLMFIGIAALGFWLSRNYPIGTALRMGTGYVPRLLCWVLLGLGVCILVSGLLQPPPRNRAADGGMRPRGGGPRPGDDLGQAADRLGVFHRRAAEFHHQHDYRTPSACISSAFSSAAPAAPRTVLWPKAMNL